MNIILYKTPTCPMCKLLIKELEEANIDFKIIDDIEILEEKNITHVPILEVKGKYMNFQEALNWVRGGRND